MKNLWYPTVLIPAAGKGQRFKDAGFRVIKPLIPIRDPYDHVFKGKRPMIEHAMHGTKGWRKIVGLPENELPNSKITASVENTLVVPIVANNGQLDTIEALLDYVIVQDAPVLILNSDVSFRNGVLQAFCYVCFHYPVDAGAIVVKRGVEQVNSYSFVDDLPAFRRGVEREWLSRWALAGAYWFRNVSTLRRAMSHGDESHHDGERYISSVFEGTPNLAFPIADENYWEFGTPEKLAAFVEEHK